MSMGEVAVLKVRWVFGRMALGVEARSRTLFTVSV